ncbi:MAG: 2-oxoacid:acceptor oxidoreductase subunit alpha, partial [Proteobacteria bacterium]|nr:2-oxoacid:acceptor oxidoreductase subunit alpha [Pseudomonadota bacterium]
QAFDLAEVLQTPVIVLSDLEIGMNEWMVDPLTWDDSYIPKRGKVLSAQELENLKTPFYRYMEDNPDGLISRTLPGTHPTKGAYFTRGSGHDKFGRYTEDSALYQENFDRLLRKWQTSAQMVPKAVLSHPNPKAKIGVLYYGSTEESLHEALDLLASEGHALSAMRIRAFPFGEEIRVFIEAHHHVLLIEQNRDAQMKTLLLSEFDMDSQRLVSLLIYDGLPLTAKHLTEKIRGFCASYATPQRTDRVVQRGATL